MNYGLNLDLTTNHGRFLSDAEIRKRCMKELRLYINAEGLETLQKRKEALERALKSRWAKRNRGTVISYFARELALNAVGTKGWQTEPVA